MQDSFWLWQLYPSESWAWKWHSCLAFRDPGSTKCEVTWTVSTTGVIALSESFFEPLVAGDQKDCFASLSGAPPVQAPGSFSVVWRIRHIERPPWLGSYSVDKHIRYLKGHPGWDPTLYSSASGIWWASLSIQLQMLGCGEREAMVMAPAPTSDSEVLPCFHGCLAFLHRRFSPQSPPSHPLSPSLCSLTAALTLGLLHNPYATAPNCCTF